MRKRITWIDIAKCFGIFAIYLGHCGSVAGKAYTFVWTHHVALFFVLAGFTEYLSAEEKFSKYLWKLLKGLLIPWMMFSIISIAVCNVLLYDNSFRSVIDDCLIVGRGTVRNQFRASSLWFITCLIVIKFLFFWIKKLKFKISIIITCLIMYLTAALVFPRISINIPSLPYNFDSAWLYIFYFGTGYCAYPFVENLLEIKTKRQTLLRIAISLFSVYFSIRLYFDYDIFEFLNANALTSVFYSMVRPLIIIWVYITVAHMCQESTHLCEIGKNSLYLCGNEYVARILIERVENMTGIFVLLETPLDAVIYTVVLILFANYILVPAEKFILEKCIMNRLHKYELT